MPMPCDMKNIPDAGAAMLGQFTFSQEQTDFVKLLKFASELFDQAVNSARRTICLIDCLFVCFGDMV